MHDRREHLECSRRYISGHEQIREGKILDGMHDLDAGIADDDIDLAKLLDHRRDAVVDLVFLGHIHPNSDGLAWPLGGEILGESIPNFSCAISAPLTAICNIAPYAKIVTSFPSRTTLADPIGMI